MAESPGRGFKAGESAAGEPLIHGRSCSGRDRDAERRRAISAKIYVGNLNFQTTKEQLTELLSTAGRIMGVYLPTDRETGRPRGFAFVEFSSEAEAAEAIRLFNEREVDGRKLRINAADDRPRRTEGFRSERPFSPSFDSHAFGGGGRPPKNKPFRTKGSRRGIRRRKRSL